MVPLFKSCFMVNLPTENSLVRRPTIRVVRMSFMSHGLQQQARTHTKTALVSVSNKLNYQFKYTTLSDPRRSSVCES